MRISFVILDITRSYGTERTTVLLANAFARQGHEVSIVSAFKEKGKPGFPVDERVRICYLTKEGYTHASPLLYVLWQYAKAVMHLRKHFKAHPQDVMIGQAFLACFFVWMAGYAKQTFACEHFKYKLYNPCVRSFRNWMYRRFRQVVVLTEDSAQAYKLHHIDAVVIPNMLPFPVSEQHPLDSKRIISVGRLQEEKGYDLLLKASKAVFAKHSDWSLDIYGEGTDRQMLERLRNDLGLTSHVRFLGFANDIRHAYLQASFYVMSSRHEGFPMVLLEAMACGLPVVSFDCPSGPAALLKNGAGLLVEAGNGKALSEAMMQMIEHPEMREVYAEKGLVAAKAYTPETICKKWETLFDNL